MRLRTRHRAKSPGDFRRRPRRTPLRADAEDRRRSTADWAADDAELDGRGRGDPVRRRRPGQRRGARRRGAAPPTAVREALGRLRAGYDERGAGHRAARRRRRRADLHPARPTRRQSSASCRTASGSRLTQAALETLAVIAYRQPVTRARVSAIRGVNVDGVVRTLLARGLIVEVGTEPDTGGGLFRTTELFLEKMGMQSLDELPSLAPLLPELDGPRGR